MIARLLSRSIASRYLTVALACVLPTVGSATNSPIELRTQAELLLTRLNGEFDSYPQQFFEQEYKTPPELVHRRVYRSFARVDMPALGPEVLLATVRYGGKDGQLDPTETLLWVVTVDQERKAIRMSPRAPRDPRAAVEALNDPARLSQLEIAASEPSGGPAGCDVWWRLQGVQLVGMTDATACTSVAKNTGGVLAWSWHWVLTDDELWINFAGRTPEGDIAVGRPDQTHWRLGKAREFICQLSYQPAVGAAVVTGPIHVHDRGGLYRWQMPARPRPTPVFLQLARGMWPSNSGRNYLELLRLEVYEGRPEDPPDSWVAIGNSFASGASDRVGFVSPELSGHCQRPT